MEVKKKKKPRPRNFILPIDQGKPGILWSVVIFRSSVIFEALSAIYIREVAHSRKQIREIGFCFTVESFDELCR